MSVPDTVLHMCNYRDGKEGRCLTPQPLLSSAPGKKKRCNSECINEEFFLKEVFTVFRVQSDEVFDLLLTAIPWFPWNL